MHIWVIITSTSALLLFRGDNAGSGAAAASVTANCLCRLKTGKSILPHPFRKIVLNITDIRGKMAFILYFASGDSSRPWGRRGWRRRVQLASLQTITISTEGSAQLLCMFTLTWQPVWGSDLQLSELFNVIFLFHWVRRRNYCELRCTNEGHALFLLWAQFELLLRVWFIKCPLLPAQSTAPDHSVYTLWSFQKAEGLLFTNVMYERTNMNCISKDISTRNKI